MFNTKNMKFAVNQHDGNSVVMTLILKYVIMLVSFQPCKEDFPCSFTLLTNLSL